MSGVVFEWDPAKAVANLAKHGVTFEEALTVFMDPMARIHGDPDHSGAERREIIVGHSIHRRLLLVSFVESGEKVRLISARVATKRERRDYEEKDKG
jgi:uncharacterized DUF497 family protein